MKTKAKVNPKRVETACGALAPWGGDHRPLPSPQDQGFGAWLARHGTIRWDLCKRLS